MCEPTEAMFQYIERCAEAGRRYLPDSIMVDYVKYRVPDAPPGRCRWCGGEVQKPRHRWCSDECVKEFCIRKGMYIDSELLKRDRGVCAVCGIDALEIEALRWRCQNLPKPVYVWRDVEFFRQWGPWPEDARCWEADHIVPVVEGGGCCGLDNLRTLCCACHRRETATLAARRAEERKRAAGLPEQVKLSLDF